MPTVEQIKTRRLPGLAVDIVVFTNIRDVNAWNGWQNDSRGPAPTEDGPHVLVIGRKNPPYAHTDGYVCLPGGFVDYGEDPYDAAFRELQEETGLVPQDGRFMTHMELVGVYGKPDRDPRQHVVSVAYKCHIPEDMARLACGADDAKWTAWIPVASILSKYVPAGFDHLEIISAASSLPTL